VLGDHGPNLAWLGSGGWAQGGGYTSLGLDRWDVLGLREPAFGSLKWLERERWVFGAGRPWKNAPIEQAGDGPGRPRGPCDG